jgi:hypothetical protein
MMRSRVVAVWLLTAGLLVAIAALQLGVLGSHSGAASGDGHEQGVSGAKFLLSAGLDEIGAIEVVDRGLLHRFERDPKGAWLYHGQHASAASGHQHISDPQIAQQIDKALTGFARTRTERRFDYDQQNDSYGVGSPAIIILVFATDTSKVLAQYAVGVMAPDDLSRYVMRVGSGTVVTIANFHIENLTGLVSTVAGGVGGGTGGTGVATDPMTDQRAAPSATNTAN